MNVPLSVAAGGGTAALSTFEDGISYSLALVEK